MRYLFLILIIHLHFNKPCFGQTKLNGTFSKGNSVILRLNKETSDFQYFVKGEMGTLLYSAGKWEQKNTKLVLSGFNSSNLKLLKVAFDTAVQNNDGTEIRIKYNKGDGASYIKSLVIINDKLKYQINGDTILLFQDYVKTIQVKSFISVSGLLSSPSKIDTLSSQPMCFNSMKRKRIVLGFSVGAEDFVRTALLDTLSIKNANTLFYKTVKLKRN